MFCVGLLVVSVCVFVCVWLSDGQGLVAVGLLVLLYRGEFLCAVGSPI